MTYNMLSFTDLTRKTEGQLLKEYLNLNVLNQLLQYCEQLIISNRQFWQKKQACKRRYTTVCILLSFTVIRRCNHSQTLTGVCTQYVLFHISRKGRLWLVLSFIYFTFIKFQNLGKVSSKVLPQNEQWDKFSVSNST